MSARTTTEASDPSMSNKARSIRNLEAIKRQLERAEADVDELAARLSGHENRVDLLYEKLRRLTGCDCFALGITCKGHDVAESENEGEEA